MAKIILTSNVRVERERRKAEAKAEAKLARKNPSEAQKLLWSALRRSWWKWRRQVIRGGVTYDFYCRMLYLGVVLEDEPTGPRFPVPGGDMMVLSFSQEEVLESLSDVAQIIEAAAATQDAALKVLTVRRQDVG